MTLGSHPGKALKLKEAEENKQLFEMTDTE